MCVPRRVMGRTEWMMVMGVGGGGQRGGVIARVCLCHSGGVMAEEV